MWPFWYICRLSSFALLGECLQNWGPRLHGGQCDGCHVSAASEDNPLPPSTLGGPCCHGLGPRAGGKDEEGSPPKRWCWEAPHDAARALVTPESCWQCRPLLAGICPPRAEGTVEQRRVIHREVDTSILCWCCGELTFGRGLFVFSSKRAYLLPIELHLAGSSQWLSVVTSGKTNNPIYWEPFRSYPCVQPAVQIPLPPSLRPGSTALSSVRP